ncbi:MAG TPA: lysophospholipid acyltransferase family protein [Gammaproteobacteria bacterium]|nr:lysophospholipid acyltransferase family protein [Gammaproteobacteria bacterium]
MAAARQWFGSIAFTLYLFLSVAVYGLVVLATAPLGHRVTYRTVLGWVSSVMFMLRWLCRLDYVVEGREHLPAQNTVLLLKHSSAWETIAQLEIFPTQTWVIKRELMWVPILGFILMLLKPIAINRSGGRSAVQQVLEQGQRHLQQGLWVAIFPEGTRVPAGESKRYGLSGTLLASAAGRAVVPVAHNAGDYWPRRGWLKRPGTVRVVIGPPIPTAGREPRDVTDQAQRWIEATVAAIRPSASK